MNKNYTVAAYMRLSHEDARSHKKNIPQEESVSIAGQRAIIRLFLKEHRELANCLVREFVDDGYSGTDFNRPGICSLLEDAKQGLIDCIIVKDLSRFGRNYIEAGNYIEQIFPLLGIRFISVSDGFDSDKSWGTVGALDMGFKNLLSDFYSKDISQKIISGRRVKAAQGRFVTGYAPYGFLKTASHQLASDPESAPIVRRIYQMALSKLPASSIAKELNRERIPSPLMLRRLRNQHFPGIDNNECRWTAAAVQRILKDRRYTGDSVYGKVRPSVIGSRKYVDSPEVEWIIVPDAHESIVPKEWFHAVQSTKKTRRK